MYNGLVHIKAVPSSALQQSWTDGSHRGWVFRGHQQSQDQARGDTALLTSGLASSPSTLPLEAPTAPSPRRVLLGPFIAFFSAPQTHLLPPSPHREPGDPRSWQLARTVHPRRRGAQPASASGGGDLACGSGSHQPMGPWPPRY